MKLFHSGHAVKCFQAIEKFGLIGVLFPMTDEARKNNKEFDKLIYAALENTDSRIKDGKPVNPAFIFAILLWQPYLQRLEQYNNEGISYAEGAWDAGRVTVANVSSVSCGTAP